MLDVNKIMRKIEVNSYKYTGVTFFRVLSLEIEGLEQLWELYLTCKNDDHMIYEVAKFIQGVYLNCA